MSWVDTCKAAFKIRADALMLKYNGQGPNREKILAKMSKESGISKNVLKIWLYEKEQERITGKPFTMPLCKLCGENKIFIRVYHVTPVKEKVCSSCYNKMERGEDGK